MLTRMSLMPYMILLDGGEKQNDKFLPSKACWTCCRLSGFECYVESCAVQISLNARFHFISNNVSVRNIKRIKSPNCEEFQYFVTRVHCALAMRISALISPRKQNRIFSED
ncbi:CLUMA_CG002719, isoform A [Clunio marinus]|uniref:CLUMA_CG002719, isoform A n=1 Tax=Clunio marinus TaxID=568069 RepID=A0A1J1HMS9_9DIPT|nr:CLUMA_CG002719, isoform A [Clunio marinus]